MAVIHVRKYPYLRQKVAPTSSTRFFLPCILLFVICPVLLPRNILLSSQSLSISTSPNRPITPQKPSRRHITQATSRKVFKHDSDPSSLLLPCEAPPTDRIKVQPPGTDVPYSLRRYARQHAALRAHLATDPHSAPPLIIWRCPLDDNRRCGGLGDRLRGMRFAFLLALATNRTLLLHTPDSPFPLLTALQPASIDWTLPKTLFPLLPAARDTMSLDHLHWHPRVSIGEAPLPRNRTLDFRIDDFRAAFEALPSVLTTSVLCAYNCVPALLHNPHALPRDLRVSVGTQSLRKGPGDRSRFVFNRASSDAAMKMDRFISAILFRPSPAVHILAEKRGFPLGMDYIGVHLRTGGDVEEGDLPRFRVFRRRGAEHTISNAVTTCAEIVLSGGVGQDNTDTYESERNADEPHFVAGKATEPRRMFIATDSARYRDALAVHARARGWDVRVADGKPLHIAQRGETESDATRCTRFLNVFAELFVLGRATAIVSTVSGFSKTAYLMGTAGRRELFLESEDGGRCVAFVDAH